MNHILRNTILGGLFLIPFFTFFVSESMLFPFITGKNFAFRIIIEIIAVLWVILALRDREYMPKRSWILYSATLFLLFMGLADLFGMSPHKSFWSNFERMEGFIAHIHFYLYFLVLSSVVFVKKTWDWLFATWIGVSVLMAFFGLVQLSGGATINQGGGRVDGTFGNATYLAVFMLCAIFLTLFFITRALSRSRFQLWFLVPIILLQITILYYTATRGAILGLLGGMILTVLLMAFRPGDGGVVRKVAVGGLIGFVLLIGGFFLVKDTSFVNESPVLSRFSSLSLSEIKTQGRFFIWPMALEGIQEKPFLGWGQENFNYIFNAKYTPAMYAQEQWFDRAHNAPLDWLVAGGVLTFIPYMALFAFFLWYLWKKEGFGLSFAEKAVLTGFLSAYFFQSLFVFDNLFSYILFFTLLAYIQAQSEGERIALPKLLHDSAGRNALSLIVIVVMTFAFFHFTAQPIRASQGLIDALRSLQAKQYEDSLNSFEIVFRERTLGTIEAREQFVSTASGFLDSSVPEETRNRYVALGLRELTSHVQEFPDDARAHIFYANFLRSIGRFDQALEEYQKALTLSPNKQPFLLEMGSTYLVQKKYAEAYELFKEASALDPRFEEARLIAGIGALYAGANAEAEEFISSVSAETRTFDNRLSHAYVELKRYRDLIEVLEARIDSERGRTDIQNFASLALAYLEVGNKPEALRVMQEARALHPDRASDIDTFINQIERQ